MRIAPEHIQEKAVAGMTGEGQPILYVLTKGGLHAFFTKTSEGVVSLGAAPHRAVAEWIAEKKSPGLKWSDEFMQKSELIKSEGAMFERARNLIFSPVPAAPADTGDLVFVYDPAKKIIDVIPEPDLVSRLKKGEHHNCFVRPVNLSEPAELIVLCPKYREVTRGR